MIQESTSIREACVSVADERVHLVGIGGTGLAGLARMYLDMGIRVSGSGRAIRSGPW